MAYQLIIANVPMSDGKQRTISLRGDDPHTLNWEKIFKFMENNNSIPRKYIACHDENGKYIYGKEDNYPDFNFENMCFKEMNGKITKIGLVSTSIVYSK